LVGLTLVMVVMMMIVMVMMIMIYYYGTKLVKLQLTQFKNELLYLKKTPFYLTFLEIFHKMSYSAHCLLQRHKAPDYQADMLE
jgi:hypothetical protein